MNHIGKCVLLMVLVGLVIGGCDSSNEKTNKEKNEEFDIYLIAHDMPTEQVLQASLDKLELRPEPLITVNDIIAYHKETHELELTASGMGKLSSCNHGQPFVVCVGTDRIYSGVFWNGLYSSLWAPIMIDLPVSSEQSSTRIWSLPSNGYDPTSDPRILESLGLAGKLR